MKKIFKLTIISVIIALVLSSVAVSAAEDDPYNNAITPNPIQASVQE